MAHPFKLTLVLLALMAKGSTAVQQRSHNHGPGWPDHCWDSASNHLMDPFCAILTDVACGAIPEVDHAMHTVPENTKAGAVVMYICDGSYSLDGNDTIVCAEVEKDGSKTAAWTETPTCVAGCSEAPLIDNGYSLPHNETSIGGIVQYVCDNLSVFSSNYNFVICQNDTLWSTPPTCERVCPSPPSISHGTYTQTAGPLFPGTEIRYFCSKQYEIRGNSTALCGQDGKWTAIPTCECLVRPLDILFILDASGSVGPDGFNQTLSFVTDIVDIYGDANTNFALISFSDTVVLGFNFNTYENDTLTVMEAVGNISYTTGSTDTALALRYAREQSFTVQNGKRDSATQIAVVVTDGASDDTISTRYEATLLKNNNVTIYSVGIGVADDKELNEIASSKSYVFYEENYSNISQISGPLSQAICVVECSEPPTIEHGYALNKNETYLGATVHYTCIKDYAFVSSSDVTCQMSGKWSDAPTCRRAQCGKIPIVLHGFSSQSNNTFVGTTVNYTCDINYRLIGMETVTCQENEVWSAVPICECQSEPMDIVFIADTSGSIGGIGFQHTLDFITKMTESYPKSTTHFGMITFSSNATVEFYLDTYVNNYTGLLQAIKDAHFSAGGTDTYEAFQLVRSEVFNVSNGMRENVTQIAVVVTDGQSNSSSLTIIEAQKLKGDGMTIYSVGVGDFDTVELKAIASNESYVFSVQTFGDLSSVTGPLSSLICMGDSS